MNKHLQAFARNFIKERLKQLPAAQQLIFNRMYSHKNLDRSVDEAVDAMPAEKLDWAMQQVEKSYNDGVASGTILAIPVTPAAPPLDEGWREFVDVLAKGSASQHGDGNLYCDQCDADLGNHESHKPGCITLRAQEYLAAHEEAKWAGHTWRCRDCFGPRGEEHSENCGVARGTITIEHCGDSPIPDRAK